MKRMHWSLVLVSALLRGVAAEPASSEDGATRPLGHIVVLKRGLEEQHLNDHLEWVKSIHKRSIEGDGSENKVSEATGVEHEYRGTSIGFHGYSGSFPPDVLENIKRHEHVDFVEEDRMIQVGPTKRQEVEEDTTPGGPKDDGKKKQKKGPGLLSVGQGYNTFLDKGMIPDAVFIPGEQKRDVPATLAEELVNQTTTMAFNFTAPSANLTSVNVVSYFSPPDPEEIMKDVLADLENEQNTTALNVIHTRATTDLQDCTGKMDTYYKITESFDSYIKALHVSGAATVSGWGQSASVSGSYLNQAELSKEGLTYIAVIDIQRQVDLPAVFEFNKNRYKAASFARDFGDKWIHGFHTGGKMIARLSFNSKGSISKQDLKVHAEASLKFWGVTGDISASVKKSMEDVSKHADVEISLFYQGDLGRVMGESGSPDKVAAASVEGSFKQVKTWADQFINNACRHNYAYRPLLDDYTNTVNFPAGQKLLDYHIAHIVSYKILKELVRISEMTQYLLRLETLDAEFKDEVEFAEIEMVELSKNWVDTTAEEPGNAVNTGKALIEHFRTEFFNKYKSAIAHDFYISGLEVVYGNKPPANRVIEVHHQPEDINHNFGGEFVWLIPLYTTRRDEACTSFTVIIGSSVSGLKDLSKGAGGENRYLKCEKKMSDEKIRRLALHRGSESLDDFLSDTRHGFVGKTTNINEGRGGSDDAVYLLWAHDGKRDQSSKKTDDYYELPEAQ
ncbi:subtilisin-like protease [Metarhizium acridum CQMa 102]|uniref:Subtilisin-like protease n=1 Tax=Metarhizium acridum (strain CQMa 102) TaxID=655827 RepID=E9E3R4_METAQ|nr:subtilisin-like protease [Metarhizium acridum CQMa 102]EFY89489.1 subtilisin-like protease [Metarhizium acridum CQMa 102]